MSQRKLKKFLSLIQAYKEGQYIYPGVIMRHLNTDMQNAYEALETIKELGFIGTTYEVYCHSCNRFPGYSFETISQLPEYLECEECFRELNPLEDSIVVYKVLIDE